MMQAKGVYPKSPLQNNPASGFQIQLNPPLGALEKIVETNESEHMKTARDQENPNKSSQQLLNLQPLEEEERNSLYSSKNTSSKPIEKGKTHSLKPNNTILWGMKKSGEDKIQPTSYLNNMDLDQSDLINESKISQVDTFKMEESTIE